MTRDIIISEYADAGNPEFAMKLNVPPLESWPDS